MSSSVKHLSEPVQTGLTRSSTHLLIRAQILKQRIYRSKKAEGKVSGTAIFQIPLTAARKSLLKLPPSTFSAGTSIIAPVSRFLDP